VETEANHFSAIKERNNIVQEQQSTTNQVSLNHSSPNTSTDNPQNRWDSWSKLKNSFSNLTKSM
jgi:hypothetical protein